MGRVEHSWECETSHGKPCTGGKTLPKGGGGGPYDNPPPWDEESIDEDFVPDAEERPQPCLHKSHYYKKPVRLQEQG